MIIVHARAYGQGELLHGEGNQLYLQREDHRLLKKGKMAADKAPSQASSLSVVEAMSAATVLPKEAALALWS